MDAAVLATVATAEITARAGPIVLSFENVNRHTLGFTYVVEA